MRIVMVWLTLFLAWTVQAVPLSPEDVPQPLQPWIDWVLHEHTTLACPIRYNDDSRACVLPGELEIRAGERGATFSQTLSVFRESEVVLPGDMNHWPMQVESDGAPLMLVARNQRPTVLLPPGEHTITGNFRWTALPASLGLSPGTGIVRYHLDGRLVRLPQIRDGSLWLRDGIAANSAKAPEDRLNLEVYRLVKDGHPGEVVTHLTVEVSGTQREAVLGYPVLAGFIPVKIESQLPAQLESDGALRVQLKPGRWTIRIHARAPAAISELRPTKVTKLHWPDAEVWVYRSSPGDRLTEVEGVSQIDPRQVRLPGDWSNLPAYEIRPDSVFRLNVVRRGDPQPEPNSLSLARDLWLDFDGDGYSIRDVITGRMTSGWRLSADGGFELGRVSVDEKPQFITRLSDEPRRGVEVRRGQLNLVAESRYESDSNAIPAIGWGRDFQQAGVNLHLPPGYQLLAVSGVDNVPASWLQRWTLYDIFLVLIISLAVGKLWGWRWSPLAVLTLGLIWQEPQAPRMIWLYLLAVVALYRFVPTQGRLHTALNTARWIGLLMLLVISLPFLVQQAREGIYPQLERHWAKAAPPGATIGAREEIHQQSASADKRVPRVSTRGQSASIAKDDYAPSSRIRQVAKGGYDTKRTLDQIDPSATIQTGPGLPKWQWRTARLSWNGPVARDQEIGIYLIGPVLGLVLNFLMIALVLALAWRFIDLKREAGRWKLNVLLLALTLGVSGSGNAADFPSPEILQQLEQRLIEPSIKPPRASIPSMTIQFMPDSYTATFAIQTLQETAIPLPIDAALAAPLTVMLDGVRAGERLFRSENRQLWLLVPEGPHAVNIEAVLPPLEQVQIPLPLYPHGIRAEGEGWTVDGIDPQGNATKQLSLIRIRESNAVEQGELTPTVLPPFLRVERTVRFGLQWEVDTRVTRVSPVGSPVSAQVPVVPGAAVVSGGVTVKDHRVLVSMAANQREVGWRSRLDPSETLTLKAPATEAWLETWRADIGPIWHIEIDGIPPVHHQDSARNWLPAWHPWPGETVTFNVQRPLGVAGNTATIDQSSLTIKPGKRVTDATLTFSLRSSQGGKRDLLLPEGAELQSVKVNGKTQPIRQENRSVSLPVVPGDQRYQLDWRQMQGIDTVWETPDVSLGTTSVNARITVHAPHDRWTLLATGPKLGPAVLFWGVLSVVLIASLILSRVGGSNLPMGFVSWLLLGMGLTQVSVLALVVLAAWFFAIRYRAGMSADTSKSRFNALQIVIALLTVASASILLWAVQTGLLGRPAMQIQGNASSAYLLNWYQDRVGLEYPQAAVYSVPLWVYRALMMAWALWLAFSLLRWVSWGWQSFSKGGIWRSVEFSLGRAGKASRAAGTRQLASDTDKTE